MLNISKREKILLIVLGIIGLCYLYYSIYLIPQLNNLNKASVELENSKKALNGLVVSQKNINEIRSQIDGLNRKAQESLMSMPDSERIPDIILELKSMGETSGCVINQVVFTQAPPGGQAKQETNKGNPAQDMQVLAIPVTCEVDGDYNCIMSFIKSIENSSRKMRVDKLTLSKGLKDGRLIGSINLSCYYINDSTSGSEGYTYTTNASGRQDLFK